MTERSVRAIAAGLLILVVFIGGFLYYSKRQNTSAISTFTDCEAAGYQVIATVPPECVTPDGKVFVDTSVTESPTASPGGAIISGSSSGTIHAGGTTGGGSKATSSATSTSTSTPISDKIRVANIAANQTIDSPLIVKGEARGNWYFEATFPVELIDGNGKRLVLTQAQAAADWMTTGFVPFTATLSFAKPTTATGTLILRNDNPSGLPENAFALRIPVTFKK